MRKIIALVLVALVVIAWSKNISAARENEAKYKECMEKAAHDYEIELYEDALANYTAALEVHKDSMEATLGVIKSNRMLGNKRVFISKCKDLIFGKKVNEDALAILTDYYKQVDDKEGMVEFLMEFMDKRKDDEPNELVNGLWNEYRGSYKYVGSRFDNVGMLLNGYTVAENDDRKYLITWSGETALDGGYEEQGYYSASLGVLPVKVDGAWYYVNLSGNKKMVTTQKYDLVSLYCEKKAFACKNGKYGYIDTDMAEISDFIWDDATLIFHGIGAVKKDGKWALINSDLNVFTDYIYDDVAINDAGYCSMNDVVFVKDNAGFHMLNTSGEQVVTEAFEDVSAPTFFGNIAVSKNGKWGFVDPNGALVIDYNYESAKSFANGYAPVKQNGLWGYIDDAGKSFIEPQFADAGQFGEEGSAPVKDEDGVWRMIKLLSSKAGSGFSIF